MCLKFTYILKYKSFALRCEKPLEVLLPTNGTDFKELIQCTNLDLCYFGVRKGYLIVCIAFCDAVRHFS
jgi:hypothetical protein